MRTSGFVLALGAAVLIAGCGATDVPGRSLPVSSVGPGMTVSPVVSQTRIELVRALGEHNLVLTDTRSPVRPAEAPLLGAAPRAVYQVILPKDPTHGYIVVYEFPDPSAAAEAATEQAAYLATGPARVQTPFGTRHVMRLVGSTVVLYSWVPDGVTDKRQPEIQPALETLGVGVPIPS